jgi:hypothetical protein
MADTVYRVGNGYELRVRIGAGQMTEARSDGLAGLARRDSRTEMQARVVANQTQQFPGNVAGPAAACAISNPSED